MGYSPRVARSQTRLRDYHSHVNNTVIGRLIENPSFFFLNGTF